MRRSSVCGLLLLAACSGTEPAPLDPLRSEAEFRARSLADPGLHSYRGRLGSAGWDLDALTFAAFYFHPDLDLARARLARAAAVADSAGAVPNPVLALAADRNLTKVPSPWLYGFSLDMPLDFLWKRGYRVEEARQLTEAARLELAEVAWQVRRRVRAALVDHRLARLELDLRKVEEAVRGGLLSALERRVAAGETFRLDADAARAELSRTRVAIAAAQGRIEATRAVLASALGVPAPALEGVETLWPGFEQPAPPADLDAREAGLLNRLDVRRALAGYAAAEAALGLELARRFPDVSIGPGYQWDHGEKKFTLGLSLTLPIFNQNGGPIAEAEARRKEAEALVTAAQARAIGETEQARAALRSAKAQLDETDRTAEAVGARERSLRRAVELGEADRVALLGVRLESVVNGASRIEALRRMHEALGALEDAMQRPAGGAAFEVPPAPVRKDGGAR